MRHPQVLDIRTESAEVLLSLAALSGSYQVQSSASRRQLKADIEEQGITNFEHFLSAAKAVIGVRAKHMQLSLASLLSVSAPPGTVHAAAGS